MSPARATPSTSTGGIHSFVSNSKYHLRSGSSEHPQSRSWREQDSLSLCLEKVLPHWVTPSNSTFFHGFIASFQSY